MSVILEAQELEPGLKPYDTSTKRPAPNKEIVPGVSKEKMARKFLPLGKEFFRKTPSHDTELAGEVTSELQAGSGEGSSMRDADFNTKPRQPGQAVLIGSIPRLVSTSLSSLSQVCKQR